MNKFFKFDKFNTSHFVNKKFFKVKYIIIYLLVFILSIGASFALSSWNSGNTLLSGDTMCFDVEYSGGEAIDMSGMTASLEFAEGSSASTTLSFSRKSNCELYGKGTITANVTSNSDVNLSSGGLKYRVVKNNDIEPVATGSISKTGESVIYDDFYILDMVDTYTVYFWLDANDIDNTYLEASFSGTVGSSAVSIPNYPGHIDEDVPVTNELLANFYYYDNEEEKIDYVTETCVGTGDSCTLMVPEEVTGTTGEYGNIYAGVSTSTGNMTSVGVDKVKIEENTTFYALYSTEVNYKYYDTNWKEESVYRNSYINNSNQLVTVLADANDSIETITASSSSNATLLGYSNTGNGIVSHNSINDVTNSNATSMIEVYQYAVNYAKGDGVSSIGKTSDSCNFTSPSTSCSVTAPSITPEENFSVLGWYDANNNRVAAQNSSLIVSANNVTYTAKTADSGIPVCLINTTNTLKSGSQTATLNCSDNSGINKYYFGTSSSGTPNTSINSTTSMNITKTIDTSGTYYLIAEDINGNKSEVVSQIYYNYTVDNYLLNVTGVKGTYTTNNYTKASSNTYIAPKDTTIEMSSVYKLPTEGVYAASSVGVASVNAPTLVESATLTSNSTYTMWFNRKEYALTITSETGGRVKVEDTTRSISVTASSGESKTLNVFYDDTIKVTATPDTGYNLNTLKHGSTTMSSGGTFTVSGAETIAGTWTLKTYTLTITSGAGGSVKVEDTTKSTSATASSGGSTTLSVTHGDTIKVTATPNTGYSLKTLRLKNANTSISSGKTFEVTGLEEVVATWSANTYTITYYVGNGTSTAGFERINTSTCTYGSSCTLTTWATLGKKFPNDDNGWEFAGWKSEANKTTVGSSFDYINGQSFTYNIADNLNLYAIGSRTFKFYAGIAPTSVLSTQVQYWNPYSTSTSYLTAIIVPTATSISGWTFIGYRANDTVDGSIAEGVSTPGSAIPGANNYTTLIYRAKYQRTLTITYNGNESTSGTTSNTIAVQYYSSGYEKDGANTGAKISTPTFTLASNGFSKTGYIFSKWAEGSTSGTQYATGATYTGFSPAVGDTTTTKTMYAIWEERIWDYYNSGSTSLTGTASSLAEAVSKVGAGGTVSAYKDNSTGSVTIGKNVTIDSNGKTITQTGVITVSSGKSVSVTGTGTFTASSSQSFSNAGTLNITGSNINNTSSNYAIYNTGNMTLNGSGVNVTSSDTAIYNSGTLEVTSASVSSTGGQGISNYTSGNVTINSGTISAPSGEYGAIWNGSTGTVSIEGGTLSGIYGASTRNGTVTISGGNITGNTAGVYSYTSSSTTGIVNITGGTLTGKNSAIELTAGTITTSGGTYTVTDSSCSATEGSCALVSLLGGVFNYDGGTPSGTKWLGSINGGIFNYGNSASPTLSIDSGVNGHGGTFNFKNGSLTTTNYCIDFLDVDNLEQFANISGGSLTATDSYVINLRDGARGTVNVSDGTISGERIITTGDENILTDINISGGVLTSSSYGISYQGTGTITMIDGTIKSTMTDGVKIRGAGKFVMSGGLIEAQTNGVGAVNVDNASAVVTISGGTLTGTSGIKIDAGTVNVDGGEIIGASEDSDTMAGIFLNGGNLNMTAGSSTGTHGLAFRGGTATISGGTLTGNYYEGIWGSTGTVTVNDGVISGVTHGIRVLADSNLTINGGTISGPNAIYGLGYRGIININGGTLTGSADAIVYEGSGTVTMTAGTVISNENSAIWTANASSNVNITGGTLTGVHGIGGSAGTINVSNANITASYCGIHSTGTLNVTINSGNITSSVYGSIWRGGTLAIKGGTLTSESDTGIYFNKGTIDMSGGKISSSNTFGIFYKKIETDYSGNGTITIGGGTISAAHPVYEEDSTAYKMNFTMSSGKLEATGYALVVRSGSTGTITGGTLTSSGTLQTVWSAGAITMGKNDGTVSTASPKIYNTGSTTYAVFKTGTSATWNFYDGIIYGKYLYNSNPNAVPSGYGIYTFSDSTYSNKAYLINTYTINYNANGGSGAPSAQTKYYAVDLTLSSTKPTRSGFKFLGWSTSSSATSASYQSGGTYTTNASATLYAVWQAETTLATYVTNLYNNGSKTAVTTAGGEAINQVTAQNLMKDSFGNIRYYGATPNNYVTFNGETAGWRIIGVFDGKIKLIKAASVGSRAWDSSSPEWVGSDLQLYLADTYLPSMTSVAQGMVATVTYYLGGIGSHSSYYADDHYNREKGSTISPAATNTTWSGKVGVMYPSDYAYAADLNTCQYGPYYYSSHTTACVNTDWLYIGGNEYTISHSSGYSSVQAMVINSNGALGIYSGANSRAVRPVVYLNTNVYRVSGSGTSGSPYVLTTG